MATRCEPDAYRDALLAIAHSRGWPVTSDYAPAALAGDRGPTHFTSSGLLIRDGAVLLERRPADATVYPGVWDSPGGHRESGESPEQTLVRELYEELGIEVRDFRLVACQDDREPGRGRLYRHHVYLVDDFCGEPASREGRTLRWFSRVELHAEGNAINPLIRWALEQIERYGW